MNSRLLLFLFLPLLGILSCRKDDDQPPVQTSPLPVRTASLFMPGGPGSYWIYETYVVDSSGNGAPGTFTGEIPLVDSFYTISDTTYGNQVYHRLICPVDAGSSEYETWAYRDSGMYIVGPGGYIILAVEDTNRIYRTTTRDAGQMSGDSVIVMNRRFGDPRRKEVPAGNFHTVAEITDWIFFPYTKDNQPIANRRQYKRFAEGWGMISETLPFYANDPRYMERRLVRSRVLIAVE